MAGAAPPSFYGRTPQVGRLPQPIDVARPLVEGVDAIARAATSGIASMRQTDERVRESDLQVARVNHQRELQMKTGDTAAYIATEAGNLQADLIKLRQQAAPGAQGYEEQVDERLTVFRNSVAERIGDDPEVASSFADNVASIATNVKVDELTWAAKQSAEKSAADIGTLDNTLKSNLRVAVMNGTANGQMIADAETLYARSAQAQPVPGNVQEDMIRDFHVGLKVTAGQAMIDSNPHALIERIDLGDFADIPDKTVNQLRESARVAADRIDNAAKQAANEGAAVERAREGNLIEDVNAAVHVDPAQLQAGQARAAASQKPEDIRLAHDLKVAIAKNEVTAKYDYSTIDERLAAKREIEGRKDWEKDEQLVAAHTQLDTLIGRDQRDAEKDPLTLYARQTGQALPELNLGDPASMAKRFLLGDRAGQRFQRPPAYFTEAEAEKMKEQFNQATPVGKAQMILQFGAFGANRSRGMMRQLAADKPHLARLTELAVYHDPAIRNLVVEALDGSAQPIKDGIAARIQNKAMSEFGPALARLPGDRANAVFRIATWIYAHRAAAEAKAGHFNGDLARASVEAALGGVNGKGGIGRARNGDALVLPAGVPQRDFDAVMAAGSADDFIHAANGGAYWNGNQPMSEAEFKQLTPVLIRDDGAVTRYAFRSKGGSRYVKTQHGEDFVLDFRQVLGVIAGGGKRH